ncbi:hypothetical protein EYF80_015233 [Liparis tanakae]|uniref:Uncharacterized protein n=1 Tax=Liparis tanakae TaxID=230148 RepID=A0A4Z2IBH1_9TELE|nr:hypothetical protein EYF80_015233 [Liparis tanakae]
MRGTQGTRVMFLVTGPRDCDAPTVDRRRLLRHRPRPDMHFAHQEMPGRLKEGWHFYMRRRIHPFCVHVWGGDSTQIDGQTRGLWESGLRMEEKGRREGGDGGGHRKGGWGYSSARRRGAVYALALALFCVLVEPLLSWMVRLISSLLSFSSSSFSSSLRSSFSSSFSLRG